MAQRNESDTANGMVTGCGMMGTGCGIIVFLPIIIMLIVAVASLFTGGGH